MSRVRNPNHYKNLCAVNIIEPDKDFRVNFLGYYDPFLDKGMEFSYRSGTLKENGVELYDDSHLEGKNSANLYFKHRPLGTGLLARWTSRGHFHMKTIVSNNNINLWDCSFENQKGDLFFIGNLCKDMPIVLEDYTYSLYVIEPTLSGDELAALAVDSQNVYKWKKDIKEAKKQVAEAHGNEIVAISMMGEARVRADIFARYLEIYKTWLGMAQDKLLEYTGKGFETIYDAINKAEMDFDIGLAGEEYMKGNVRGFADKMNIQIKTVEAMTNADLDATEVMKKHLFNVTMNFIGLAKMKEYMNHVNGEQMVYTPSIAAHNALNKINPDNLTKDEHQNLVKRVVNTLQSVAFEKNVENAKNNEELTKNINNALKTEMIQINKGNIDTGEEHAEK